jgi:transcriptional regulator GlxA family with amidase domain
VLEERFVRDGTVWTSAGISAGMDLVLAYIAEVAGEETAGAVQSAAEVYPSPLRYGTFPTTNPAAPAYIRNP